MSTFTSFIYVVDRQNPASYRSMKNIPVITKLLYFFNSGKDGEVTQILDNGNFVVYNLDPCVVKDTDTILKSIEQFNPDLILADYHEGHTKILVKTLAASKEQLPLILLTSEENEDAVLPYLESGAADDFLYCDRLNKLPILIKKTLQNRIKEFSLKENYTKYRSIYENSIDGILLTTPDGQVLAANPAACSLFQMTEKEICMAGRKGLVDSNDPLFSKALEERKRTGKVKVELMMKRKNGSTFSAEITSSVFQHVDGQARTSMIIRDISQSKRAEEQLRNSNNKYKQLFENSPLPSIIYDVNNYEILEVNLAATQHYDYTKEEFLNLTIPDFLPNEDIVKFKSFLQNEDQEDGKVIQHRMMHLKKGNTSLTVETFGYSLEYKNRKCRLAICLDVSEKEEYLRTIKTKNLKLQTAQEIAKLGYWELDISTNKLFWSEEVYNIWDQNSKDFVPNFGLFMDTLHPEDRSKFDKAQHLAVSGEKDLDIEHRIILPEGSVKWVHERGKLAPNFAGDMVLSGSVQDITERKIIAEKLSRSEARNRAILKSQTNYLIRTDLEGNYSYVNEKFQSDFKWIFPDKEIIGKYANSSVQPYHQSIVEETFHKCLLNPNVVFQIEIDKLQEDGGSRSTLWDFICLTDSEGQPLELQCVGIDITDRVRTERSLQESNNRNELVLKATSDVIYDWNCTTGKILWSEGYKKNFGYDTTYNAPDIHDWAKNVHPDDSEVVDEVFNVLKGESDIFQAEYRYKKANGQYAYVVERGSVVRDSEGKALRMVGAMQDVTDTKLALLQLMKSEARHKGLIQSQTNYMVRIDLEGKYSYANKKFNDDFGWIHPGKDIIGANSMDSVMPYHFSRLKEVAEKCLANPDRIFQVEIDKPAKFGKVKTTLWDMILLKGAAGEKDEIQCVGIDISDRVRAEAENHFQANLLNKIGQAVIATDLNGKVVYWNNAAFNMYGWNMEEALGENLYSLFPCFPGGDLFKIPHGEETKETSSREIKVQNKKGDEIDIFLTCSPVYNEEGELTGFIGVSSDITERIKADNELKKLNRDLKKYTEELVTANKGLEQFSYIISHNLRAPVANIIGLGNLIEEDTPEEVQKQFREEMLNNVKRLDLIIKDLNDILQVKVETSEKKEIVDLEELVTSIKSGIGQVIERENVKIITDFTEAPSIDSINTYLHSVFYNLIFNSIKYRKPDETPVINIKSRQEQNKVVITFEDNGMGIDLKKRGDEIFGLYKRFHHHVEGKGMGLFMVKTQVELMGGKIDVSSEVNKGSVFTIEFAEDKKNLNIKNEDAGTVFSN